MKKRNIKLLTVLLAITLVSIASIFYACKKEESIPIVNNIDTPEYQENDYATYIEELILSTGIDVKGLSKLYEVQRIANVQREIRNTLTQSSQSKGDFSEAKLEQMQNLYEAMLAAGAAGNENEVLALYESYCNICMTIDYFQMNENGIPIFTYNPDSPLGNLEKEMLLSVALMNNIIEKEPSFPSLPYDTQVEIIAAAIYLNLQNSGAKGLSVEDCRKEALNMYTITSCAATAELTATLIGCAFAGPGAGACCAAAGAWYGVQMGIGYWQYRRAIRNCV